MEESLTSHLILERGRGEGRAEECAEGLLRGSTEDGRAVLLRCARNKLGEPTAAELEALNAIEDSSGLERMSERMFDVKRTPRYSLGVRPIASRLC